MEINGKKVVDATKPIKIKISQRDATEGATKDPGDCAAARAAKRDVPNCISARVHVGRVYVEQKDKWVRYFTPDALRTEIVAFDRGGTFQPGEYELKAPSEHESEEGRAKARKDARIGKVKRGRLGNAPTKHPRKTLVAKIKRHEVSGVRPKGANR
jgi:hypothetical protein